MRESILDIHGLCKRYFGVAALADVSLSIPRGRVLGLIGENGAGKSTLMNVLGGVTNPDSGTLALDGRPYQPRTPIDAKRAGIAFIHQELNLFGNLSVLDNIFIDGYPRLGKTPLINKAQARQRAREMLAAVDLQVSIHTPVERLSLGEKQLLEIARALGSEAKVIIFDEPTTSLTAMECERLFDMIEHLRREKHTVIYISHNLNHVLKLADEIAVLRDGRLVRRGPVQDFSLDRMITDMVGRDMSQMFPARRSQVRPSVALEAQGLCQPGLVHHVSLQLFHGEILGLFGLMGSGRSELARILFGLDPFTGGRIAINGQRVAKMSPSRSILHKLGFVTENRREEGLLMEADVLDNVALAALPRHTHGGPLQLVNRSVLRQQVHDLVQSLRIKTDAVRGQDVQHLSGGNQQKVVIAKWLLTRPEVLILDEPTRGIDVGAKHEVYSLMNDLATRGTGILCISSELEELLGTCDRILVMGNGEIQGTFPRDQFDEAAILRAAFQGYQRHAVPVRAG
jgi:ABC-type sugar transport system ATPase subunit